MLFLFALLVAYTSAAQCSEQDKAKIRALPVSGANGVQAIFGRLIQDQTWNLIFGSLDETQFASGMADAVGASVECAGCFAKAAAYATSNCRMLCLRRGLTSSECSQCNQPAKQPAEECTGMSVSEVPGYPFTAVAFEAEAEVGTGQCTAGDKAKIKALPAKGPGNIKRIFKKLIDEQRWTIIFGLKQEKFATGLAEEVGASLPCARCFATAAAYASSNCKGTCLVNGLRSDQCRECNQPASAPAESCSGLSLDTDVPGYPFAARQSEAFEVSVAAIAEDINGSDFGMLSKVAIVGFMASACGYFVARYFSNKVPSHYATLPSQV